MIATVAKKPNGKADVAPGTDYRVISDDGKTLTIELPDPTPADARALLARLDAEQRIAAVADKVTPEQAAILAPLLSTWTGEAETVTAGTLRVVDGIVYEAIQDHTTQEDWSPKDTPALWKVWRDPDGGPTEWVQPLGAHDAYSKGDQVTHKGQTWTSDLDGNVWEPGVYGWTATT